MESLAGNHGFADGNKRTTLLVVQLLLDKSGFELCPEDESESIDEAVEAIILDVARGKAGISTITAWFEARIRRKIQNGAPRRSATTKLTRR